MDLGDRVEDATIDFKFSTRNVSAAPATLAGTPVLSVYKSNGTTESTAGVTLTVDFDSRTGLNHVRLVTTDAFYAAGEDYEVVITTGTVNSVSVVGTTIATFSIENRFMRGTDLALQPTVASRTLDVTATGAAGIDWGNIENKTTTNDLSATDIQLVDTTTTNTDMRGTDSALLAADINLTGGAVDNVTLVATTTTNTDMRGTDGVDTATMRGTDNAALAADQGTVTKNATFSNFEFLMVLTSDHVTPATGLTVTGQRSIDGGSFASVAGTIAEVSNGIYQFDALAADTNGDLITWRFSSGTADDTFVTLTTTA